MYETVTLENISLMTHEEKAIAIYALKQKAITGGWSIESKYGEFIDGAGNSWLATIGISGFPNLFVGRDDASELAAIMKAFEAAMEAIRK